MTWNIAGGLLALFTASILVSQSAMDFFAILMSLFFLFGMVRSFYLGDQKIYFFRLGPEKFIALWLLVLLAGALLSPYGPEGSLIRLTEFKWLAFVYVLVFFLKEVEPNDRIVNGAIWLLCLGSLVAAGVFLLGYDPFKGPDFPVTVVDGGIRTGGFLSNPMTFAHVYGMVAALYLGPWIYFWLWKDRRKWWLGLSILLAISAVVMSFTRGAWAALGVSFLVSFFFVRRSLGFLFLGLSAGAVFLLSTFWEGFRQRLTLAFHFGNQYDSERLWIWKANLQIVKEHPVFGVGYGQNKSQLQIFYDKIGAPAGLLLEHAHNQYLHMAAGTGIVGLLMYLFTFGSFFWLSIKVFRAISDREYWKKGLSLGTINVQVFFFIGSLTEGNFEHSKIKYLISLTWALIVWLAYDERLLKERVK